MPPLPHLKFTETIARRPRVVASRNLQRLAWTNEIRGQTIRRFELRYGRAIAARNAIECVALFHRVAFARGG